MTLRDRFWIHRDHRSNEREEPEMFRKYPKEFRRDPEVFQSVGNVPGLNNTRRNRRASPRPVSLFAGTDLVCFLRALFLRV